MSFGGYPSIVCFTNMASRSFEKTSWQLLSDSLRLRYKTQRILSESESIIVDLDLNVRPQPVHEVLSARVAKLEGKLDQLESELPITEGKYHSLTPNLRFKLSLIIIRPFARHYLCTIRAASIRSAPDVLLRRDEQSQAAITTLFDCFMVNHVNQDPQ